MKKTILRNQWNFSFSKVFFCNLQKNMLIQNGIDDVNDGNQIFVVWIVLKSSAIRDDERLFCYGFEMFAMLSMKKYG